MSDRRTEIAQLVGIDPGVLRDLKASLVDALVRKWTCPGLVDTFYATVGPHTKQSCGLPPPGRRSWTPCGSTAPIRLSLPGDGAADDHR